MSEYRGIVNSIMSQISSTDVEVIFGESRQIGDKAIIPVGKISYGWGGGGGRGTAPKEKEGEGEGSGIGMGVKVKPIGFIVVTADRVTYEPIIDLSLMWTIYGAVMGFALLTLIKTFARAMFAKSRHCRYVKGKKLP